MPLVYVGIGSNLEPFRHVRSAVAALAERYGPVRASPVYSSAAVGGDGPDYLNLVVELVTAEAPIAVAAALERIESAHGREKDGSRQTAHTLDLDLLLYDDLILNTAELRLPREDILRYAFVLRPLADLLPDGRHPLAGERYAELWRAFPADTQPLRMVEVELP